jgi:hypothetical protein
MLQICPCYNNNPRLSTVTVTVSVSDLFAPLDTLVAEDLSKILIHSYQQKQNKERQ